jgi:sugar lactone lactonase YvrE
MNRVVACWCASLCLVAVLVPRAARGQACFDVKVFAGRGVGDGGPATAAVLSAPRNVLLDAAGNILIADAGNARVRRIDTGGTITTIAGNGAPGIPDDGVPATAASLKEPSGVAVSGTDLFIADAGDNVNTVWRVGGDGLVRRFAGSGIGTGSIDGEGGDPTDDLNDGQLAVFATLSTPVRVAVDSAGSVFISDLANGRIRRVDAASGVMTTAVAGLTQPIGIAIAGDSLYIANSGTSQILKAPLAGGAPTVIAGTGTIGIAADRDSDPPLLAVNAPLHNPGEVAIDASGVVFIADTGNGVVHRVTPDGLIHRVAGTGQFGDTDGPGIFAKFQSPGVALGPAGSLLVPDVDNDSIRRIDPTPPTGYTVSTIAGGKPASGDGGPATGALLDRPAGLAVDAGGNVLITEHDSHRVRRVDPAGNISSVVNAQGLNDPATDGAPAVASPLRQPTGVALDANGQMLIADAQDHRVLLVDTGGIIRTFAGVSNTPGFSGDGGPATSAELNTPLRMAVGSDGTVYIADFNNNRIRTVDASGTINTFVGNAGELNQPSGLVFDANGNLFVADFGSNRVLKIDPSGTVSLVAGSGTPGHLGDNGAAGTAQLNGPTAVAFASDGGLLIVDQLNSVIRYVAPGDNGIDAGSTITTLLGSGTPTFADGPGTAASFLFPTDVVVDASGNILVADRGNQRVRIATPGNDCVAQQPCTDAGSCDDGDPCTVDACNASHLCTHTPLPAGRCVPSCAAEAAGCIAGGGPARTDCLAEALVKGLEPGQARPVVRCKDNDGCDFDPTSGTCTFQVAWCFNEPGCSVSGGVSRFSARGRAAGTILDAVGKLVGGSAAGSAMVFPQPYTTSGSCTELAPIQVTLRKNGRKPGKVKIKTTAFGSSRKVRDPDTLTLVCTP